MAIRDECPEIALQGMTNMIPALTGYIDKTPRPLIGHLPVSGIFIIGALSGYGLMVACASGELLASQIARS
jgi:glycine/D-amino acid oxidase-like deaminating enzyme